MSDSRWNIAALPDEGRTQSTPEPTAAPESALILLLASGAGLSVAAVYYNQPMLNALADEFHASPAAIGRVPTWTQVGYALGIFLLTPLGDRVDRRLVILAKAALLAIALLALSAAQSLLQLCVVSIIVGISASLAQDCVPAAAALAPPARRGKVVGSVMTGLLLGILLSRVVAGHVTEHFGWRAMFVFAAASVATLFIVAARRLPKFAPTTNLPYMALLGTLATLLRRYSALRRAALAQLLLSAAFSAFWSTLAIMLHRPPFGFGSSIAGLFGLAGAAGAIAARVAGGIADRRGPELVSRVGAFAVWVSFIGFAAAPQNLWFLVAGTLLFDLGLQACVVSHQTIIYALEPNARSRINAVFIGGMFMGMAGGSYLGSMAYTAGEWRGVCLFSAGSAFIALIIRLLPRARQAAAMVPVQP